MPVVTLSSGHAELAWELRTADRVVARVDALDGETVWITRITVQPGYRGHGYATVLLRTVLDTCSDTLVGLAANPLPTTGPGLDRDALRAWYARHGFVHAPLRDDPYRMLRPPVHEPSPTPFDATEAGR